MSSATLMEKSPLGKPSSYHFKKSDRSLLFPIPRKGKRDEIPLSTPIPFHGVDIWNAYEISWLNPKGKPEIAIGEFIIPCQSENIIESKSLKLYLNSLHQTNFTSIEEVEKEISQALSEAAKSEISVTLLPPSHFHHIQLDSFHGLCIDEIDIETNTYEVTPSLLQSEQEIVEEKLFSNLLKSNCPVTGQPDWCSIFIHYTGTKINHAALLKYLISFRNNNDFHEQCIERIFHDLQERCHVENLTVYGRYTRRGGIDINPFRSNLTSHPINFRDFRQ